MRRLSKLKVVTPMAADSEIARHRADHESPLLPETAHAEAARPVWHKDNYGFWLVACIMISVVFSVVFRAFV